MNIIPVYGGVLPRPFILHLRLSLRSLFLNRVYVSVSVSIPLMMLLAVKCGHLLLLTDLCVPFSYFMTDSEEILLEQKGIVRTNCIDCLDRTNVTQVHNFYPTHSMPYDSLALKWDLIMEAHNILVEDLLNSGGC